jgi:hypothetical protein
LLIDNVSVTSTPSQPTPMWRPTGCCNMPNTGAVLTKPSTVSHSPPPE